MHSNESRSAYVPAAAALMLAVALAPVRPAAALTRMSMSEPVEPGISGHLYVPPANLSLPKGQFGLVLWQANPHQSSGLLVQNSWNAGSQTGFTPVDPSTAQKAFRNVAGSTTAQMEGGVVGAYLNSADLPTLSAAQKLMITPEYRFVTGSEPMPFSSSGGSIDFGLDLQVPVAAGDQAYAALDFEFIDPNGARLSYGIKLFHYSEKHFTVESGYDSPTSSYQVREPLGWDSQFATAAPGSASETGTPWLGWRHFQWTISEAQFVAALHYLASQYPTVAISQDPTHYLLSKVHLNAEIHFTTTQTELGWSMRGASLTFTH